MSPIKVLAYFNKKNGWSSAYVSESIKYDVDTKYIVDDNEAFKDMDPEVQS